MQELSCKKVSSHKLCRLSILFRAPLHVPFESKVTWTSFRNTCMGILVHYELGCELSTRFFCSYFFPQFSQTNFSCSSLLGLWTLFQCVTTWVHVFFLMSHSMHLYTFMCTLWKCVFISLKLSDSWLQQKHLYGGPLSKFPSGRK